MDLAQRDASDLQVVGQVGEVVVRQADKRGVQQILHIDLFSVVKGAVGADVQVPGVLAQQVELQILVVGGVPELLELDIVDHDEADLRLAALHALHHVLQPLLHQLDLDGVLPVGVVELRHQPAHGDDGIGGDGEGRGRSFWDRP